MLNGMLVILTSTDFIRPSFYKGQFIYQNENIFTVFICFIYIGIIPICFRNDKKCSEHSRKHVQGKAVEAINFRELDYAAENKSNTTVPCEKLHQR